MQLEQAIAIRRAINDLYSEGADCGNFAIALLTLGMKGKCREYALRARNIFERIGLPALVKMMDQVIKASEE